MRWQRLTLVILVFAFAANAAPPKVIKVLPHFLDLKGRDTVAPSLFDRDAYQNQLRDNPSKRSALRFDIQWKAPNDEYGPLTLRVEAKGMKGKEPTARTNETAVMTGTFSKWSAVTIGGDDYKSFGELISWRVRLIYYGTNVIAEQKSFLW